MRRSSLSRWGPPCLLAVAVAAAWRTRAARPPAAAGLRHHQQRCAAGPRRGAGLLDAERTKEARPHPCRRRLGRTDRLGASGRASR